MTVIYSPPSAWLHLLNLNVKIIYTIVFSSSSSICGIKLLYFKWTKQIIFVTTCLFYNKVLDIELSKLLKYYGVLNSKPYLSTGLTFTVTLNFIK